MIRTTQALALLAPLAAARADEPALEVARALAGGATTPAEAAAAWPRLRLDPDDALALVRRAPLEVAPLTSHRAMPTLPSGETTDAEVVFPRDGPDGGVAGGSGERTGSGERAGRYRLLILLHGIGGDARQSWARSLVPAHTLAHALTLDVAARR